MTTQTCATSIAPPGWACQRELGHEGPCAAVPLPTHAYTIGIKSIGIEAPLWTWQVDLEPGNGVLDHGTAQSRRAAVRMATRQIRKHSRRTRKERSDPYWHRESE